MGRSWWRAGVETEGETGVDIREGAGINYLIRINLNFGSLLHFPKVQYLILANISDIQNSTDS